MCPVDGNACLQARFQPKLEECTPRSEDAAQGLQHQPKSGTYYPLANAFGPSIILSPINNLIPIQSCRLYSSDRTQMRRGGDTQGICDRDVELGLGALG